MTLGELLDRRDLRPPDLLAHLEQLSAGDRAVESMALSAARQERLWALAAGSALGRGMLLPSDSQDATATYLGRNSLGGFSRFEKRFFRRGTSVFGFNKHPLGLLIGPGYFAVDEQAGGRLRFDYNRLPPGQPPGWPAIVRNTRLLSRPVYGNLVDAVVWVTSDVLVGAAYRGDTPLHSFFVLVRSPEVRSSAGRG